MRHLDTSELIRFAIEEDRGLRSHVDRCPKCTAEVAGLRGVTAAIASDVTPASEAGPGCLSEHEIARLADGTATAGEGGASMGHLAACARCRTAVTSVSAMLVSDGVARELASLEPGRSRVFRYTAAALATAAIVLILIVPRHRPHEPSVHRERPVTAAPAPVTIAPVGPVSEARVLRWRGVPGADRYRVTLVDGDGSVLHEAFSSDTVVELPASLALEPGRAYFWTVAARTDLERWIESDYVRFILRGGVGR